MTSIKDPDEQLYITSLLHKAFIAVDEEGTEATAATATGMMRVTSVQTTVPFTPLI